MYQILIYDKGDISTWWGRIKCLIIHLEKIDSWPTILTAYCVFEQNFKIHLN